LYRREVRASREDCAAISIIDDFKFALDDLLETWMVGEHDFQGILKGAEIATTNGWQD
jgi:hypothetical protein